MLPPEALCVFCGVKSTSDKPCVACAKHHALDRVIVAADYNDSLVRKAIHALKYQGVKGLAGPLGQLLVKIISQDVIPAKAGIQARINPQGLTFGGLTSKNLEVKPPNIEFLVIPLPLHSRRLKTRGYNQAKLLAHSVAQALGVPLCIDLLVRVRDTSQQVGLTGEERRANLQNAFSLTRSHLALQGETLKGSTILLIDDVTTTGTTLDEAAKVLKHAGAKAVWGLVVARG